MNKSHPYHLLSRWKRNHLLTYGGFVLTSIATVILLWQMDGLHFITGLAWTLIFSWYSYKFYWDRPSLKRLTDALHLSVPELEYSVSLFTYDRENLNQLEKLQVQRVDNVLSKLNWNPSWPLSLGVNASIPMILLIGFTYLSMHHSINTDGTEVDQSSINKIPNKLSDSGPLTFNSSIQIVPPSYTKIKKNNTTIGSNLNIPEGSKLSWEISFNRDPSDVEFKLNENTYSLEYPYQFNRRVVESGYYQLTYSDLNKTTSSDYFAVDVIKDAPPEIQIKGIEEFIKLPYQPDHRMNFEVEIKDDYNIEDAYISATVAKGSGESVKFREKRLNFTKFKKGSEFKATYSLSLNELDMEPGSELYFYVSAQDNCPFRENRSKSITHIIVLEDTTSYTAYDDGGMQVDLMPDFFRSQRQIIIDSEKLLSEKSSISTKEFNYRSNALGFDQKQLRLKYGQFLGEESESGIAIETEFGDEEDPSEHEVSAMPGGNPILAWGRNILEQFGHNHDHEDEAGQRFEENGTLKKEDPAKPSWVEELSHNHDNVEMNTYFEMPIKTKLKAALSQMWDSELHLRLYDPKTSLPFQYQALALLQEIKNHARIYVHRLGFDPPPIKEEKRLTGELDDIYSFTDESKIESENYISILRALNQLLSKDKSGAKPTFDESELNKIKSLGDKLSGYATDQLDLLPILSMLQKIIIQDLTFDSTQFNQLLYTITVSIPADTPAAITSSGIRLSKVKSDLIKLYKS